MDDYYEGAARAAGKREGETVGGGSDEDGPTRAQRQRDADRDRDRTRRRPDANSYTSFDAAGEAIVTTFGDGGQAPFVRAGSWAARRAALARADLTEQNWMLEAARSVRGMNAELVETRRERLVAFRGPQLPNEESESESESGKEEGEGEGDEEEEEEGVDDRPPWEREAESGLPENDSEIANNAAMDLDIPTAAAHIPLRREASGAVEEARAAKRARREERKRRKAPPIGLYEPHTHLPHFLSTTQPTRARIEKVRASFHLIYLFSILTFVYKHTSYQIGPYPLLPPSTNPTIPSIPSAQAVPPSTPFSGPVLGGTRVGSCAWGVSTFSVEISPPRLRDKGVRVPKVTGSS